MSHPLDRQTLVQRIEAYAREHDLDPSRLLDLIDRNFPSPGVLPEVEPEDVEVEHHYPH
jgi:hypothetical protein